MYFQKLIAAIALAFVTGIAAVPVDTQNTAAGKHLDTLWTEGRTQKRSRLTKYLLVIQRNSPPGHKATPDDVDLLRPGSAY